MHRFAYDRANEVLVCQCDGEITDESVTAAVRSATRTSARLQPKVFMMDLSRVTAFHVSAATIWELAALKPADPSPTRRRVVIAPADDVFGRARMFQMAGEALRPGLLIYRSLEDAYVALGISNPQFEEVQGEAG